MGPSRPFVLALLLAASASAASLDFLAPFWGSELAPVLTPAYRASLSLDQFTELDNERRRFPLDRRSDTCEAYCETIGFNTLQVTRTWTARNGWLLTAGGFAGAAHDGLTEFLQNEYSHKRAGVAPVPREGVREGILFGAVAEAHKPFLPYAWLGGGLAWNNAYGEAFLQAATGERRRTWGEWKFGFKAAATGRAGALVPSREYLVAGTRYFDRLHPLLTVAQGEAGIVWRPWGVPLEFSWRGSYSTGAFVDPETDKPAGMWLEGLKTVIWKFSFERYNDALNGTDYGPTYGVRAAWTLET